MKLQRIILYLLYCGVLLITSKLIGFEITALVALGYILADQHWSEIKINLEKENE